MLTEKQVLKFQRIYKERFGKEISKKEAYEQGIKLVNLMQIIISDLPKGSEIIKENQVTKTKAN